MLDEGVEEVRDGIYCQNENQKGAEEESARGGKKTLTVVWGFRCQTDDELSPWLKNY